MEIVFAGLVLMTFCMVSSLFLFYYGDHPAVLAVVIPVILLSIS